MRAAGGSANLEGDEAELGFSVGREEVGELDGDGADEDVAEPGVGIDLDHDDGVVGIEEAVLDAEDELLVPGGIGVAFLVHLGGQFALRVEPRHRVAPNGFRHLGQVLGRDHVDLKELVWGCNHRHGWI